MAACADWREKRHRAARPDFCRPCRWDLRHDRRDNRQRQIRTAADVDRWAGDQDHDPTIVNFLLVDFKGGAAFDEFRELPHCVDIVTNLEGNAVDRMFSAIKAELDRRGEMIAQYGVKHIIDYRRRGYHLTDEKRRHPNPARPNQDFPHLFIVIDEFAEMVAENPEYKAQLDSITRLGRAIGVSLVLATAAPGRDDHRPDARQHEIQNLPARGNARR